MRNNRSSLGTLLCQRPCERVGGLILRCGVDQRRHDGSGCGMMLHCVASPAVSDLLPGAGLARATHPDHCREGRRDPRPAPRGRDLAAAASEASLVLVRPGRPCGVDPAAAQTVASVAAGAPGDRAHLAPPAGRQEMDPPQPWWPTPPGRRPRRPDRTARRREPFLGLRSDPGRAAQARPPGSAAPRSSGYCGSSAFHPRPQRSQTSWRQFLRTQADTILACDFLHVDCAVTLTRACMCSL
jgi:hypothetical protein